MQNVSIKTTHEGLSPGHITLFGPVSGNFAATFDGTGVAVVPLDVAAANVSATTPGFEALSEADRLDIEIYQHHVVDSPVVAFDAGPMMRVTVLDPDFKGLKITVSASGIDTEAAFNDHGVALIPLAFAQTFTEEAYPGRTIEPVLVEAPHAPVPSAIIEKTLMDDIARSNDAIAENTAPENLASRLAANVAEDADLSRTRSEAKSGEKGDGTPVVTSPLPTVPSDPLLQTGPIEGETESKTEGEDEGPDNDLDDDLEGDLDFDTAPDAVAPPAVAIPVVAAISAEQAHQANIEEAIASDPASDPVAETPVAETPVAETPVAETPKTPKPRPSRAKAKPEAE